MAFDSAQFLSNPIRLDRFDTMTPTVMEMEQSVPIGETGSLNGATVVIENDPHADLMDSLEELSMAFEEKTSKKISERRLGETKGSLSAYLKALEIWQKTMPDMASKEAMDNLLRRLRNAAAEGNLPDVAGLKNMLAEISKDPSHQFAMLDILEQALNSDEGEIRQLVNNARESLMKEKGGEIRAGINLASAVNARATTPEEMSNLRNLYRGEILGFTTPQECFRSILSSRGAGNIDSAIDFLMAGCGVDLASATPSMDPVELRRIMLDLQCVQVLKSVLDSMNSLSARMAAQFGEKMLLNSESMTGRIVDFTDKPYVYSDQIAAFSSACGVRALLARMDFARELIWVFRKLSPRLFSLEDDRLRLIEAAQEHLDGIISEEEAAKEEEERDSAS